MAVLEIPRDMLREPTHEWNLAGSTFSPGQSGTGAFGVGRMDGGGQWIATIKDIKLRSRADVLLWRAIRNICQGGATPIIVPRREVLTPPFPTVAGVRVTSNAAVNYSDDMSHSDNTGYRQAVISAHAVGDADLRATQIVIDFLAGTADPLLGGEVFSIDHPVQGWRMYEIKSVTLNDGGDSIVNFEPPLREGVSDGATIEFDQPRCIMRLYASSSMDFELRSYPFGQATMTFIERVYPYPA